MDKPLPTPWADLNKHLQLRTGELILLVGPVSSGTSMTALNIAIHAGFDLGHPTHLYSTEISHDGTMDRIIANRLSIDSAQLRNRTVSDDDLARIKTYGQTIANVPVKIHAGGLANLPGIRNDLASRQGRQFPTRLVMVDGVATVAEGTAWTSKDARTGGAQQTAALRQMAREFDVTMLVTAHLARRPTGAPMLDDVAPGLVAAADTVLLVSSPDDGCVSVQIAKNPGGGVGAVVELAWQPEFCRLRSPHQPA